MNVFCERVEEVEETVAGEIRQYGLLQGVKRLGVAVSGGADSLALLLLLQPVCKSRGVETVVLNINHGRPKEDEYTEFVRETAERLGLPFVTRLADISSEVEDGRSIELAARNVRMAFFQTAAREQRLDAIATGHQADDVAETLFLRLSRGAGLSGLAGLRPRSDNGQVVFIRPLLFVPHRVLCEWLEARGQPWKEDPDNRDLASQRNQVRLAVFPSLEKEFDLSFRRHLCKTAELLREEDSLFAGLAEKSALLLTCGAPLAGAALPVAGLLALDIALQRRVLRQWFFANGQADSSGWLSTDRILSLSREEENWAVTLSAQTRLVCGNGALALVPAAETPNVLPPVPLAVPGKTHWGNWLITVEPCSEIQSESHGVGEAPAFATISGRAVANRPLLLRSRLPGDRIAPTGLKGTKKIHDVMIDAKVPEAKRGAIPLLVCGDDVVWLPGYRISRFYAVGKGDTSNFRLLAQRRSMD